MIIELRIGGPNPALFSTSSFRLVFLITRVKLLFYFALLVIWPAVVSNTLAAVTRSIGCVAASDLATAIAAAAAVEIVGVAAASAAVDIEAGGTAAGR